MNHTCDKIAWQSVVPEHWQVLKLRQILSPVSEKNHPDLPLLSVVREKGVIVRNIEDKEENHNYVPDDLSGYKLVKIGQFAMNKMKAWQGSYGVSRFDGIVSPAYFVFDIQCDINKDFFNRAIRSVVYVNYFGQASDGIRVGQWDLSIQRMKEIPFIYSLKRMIRSNSKARQKLFAVHTDFSAQFFLMAMRIGSGSLFSSIF